MTPVRAINPKLIYCSITGYGQTGPRAGEAGHDLNYIGHTGLLALNPGPPDRPVVPPALIADIAGGTLAGGDEHSAGLAPARPERAGLPSRHRHDRCDVHLRQPRARVRTRHRTISRHGRRAADRRLAALPDLSDEGRQVRLLRGAGAEILGAVHRDDRARAGIRRRPPRSGGDQERRSPQSSPAGPPRNGGRCLPPPIAASPSWRRCEEALRDPHFVERGLFAHQVAGPTGATMPALPVPIDPQFRGDAGDGEGGAEAQR